MKLHPPGAGRKPGGRLRWFWQLLLGAAVGVVPAVIGYFVTGDVDWFVAIPLCGILFAVEPLNVIWLMRRK
jgi:heme O synthase-like polyprenyltransferase